MSDKKYYFITYTINNGRTFFNDDVIDMDPVQWIINTRKSDKADYSYDVCEHILIYSKEITKEQYDQYKAL